MPLAISRSHNLNILKCLPRPQGPIFLGTNHVSASDTVAMVTNNDSILPQVDACVSCGLLVYMCPVAE